LVGGGWNITISGEKRGKAQEIGKGRGRPLHLGKIGPSDLTTLGTRLARPSGKKRKKKGSDDTVATSVECNLKPVEM